ncbi:MAG: four helix bundle protein [Cytophagaceae bacterium]|nr:four helix bundle protein [Cytophagaceae bacterium]
MKTENTLLVKSYAFALRMVKLQQFLVEHKKEYVLSKQAVRSGTSIGANLEEANQAESLADFIHKLSVSNKEAHETYYWLRLLRDSECLDGRLADSLLADCSELIGMLIASIKTNKRKQALRLNLSVPIVLIPLIIRAFF